MPKFHGKPLADLAEKAIFPVACVIIIIFLPIFVFSCLCFLFVF